MQFRHFWYVSHRFRMCNYLYLMLNQPNLRLKKGTGAPFEIDLPLMCVVELIVPMGIKIIPYSTKNMNYGLCVTCCSKILKIGKAHFGRSEAENHKFEEFASLGVHAATILQECVLWVF